MYLLLAILLFLFLTILAFLLVKIQDKKDVHNLQEAIKNEVQQHIKRYGCGSISIGIYKNGKSFFYGQKSKTEKHGITLDENTVFEIGSLTKLLTATTIQSICDDGLLSRKDKLSEIFRDDAFTEKVGDISILELLTHTSGLPRVPKTLIKSIKDIKNPYCNFTREDIFSYLKNPDDTKQTGRFLYSNIGYGLLGYVIEKINNKTFEQTVKEKITTPLSMLNTTISSEENIISGYNDKCGGASNWRFDVLEAAGAYKSTAKDMLSFAISHLQNGTLSNVVNKLKIFQSNGITAVGWMRPTPIDKLFGNKNILWHDGQTGGYASYICIDDKNNFAVVILSNKSTPVNMLGVMLAKITRTQSFGNITVEPKLNA